jgi:N-acetylmuramoyl-L-alanine amidase
MVNGNDSFDFVSVALEERLPYRSMQELGPSRIIVDVFGATSNTNWITQRSGAREIRQVRYDQIEDDVFRIIIELRHEQHWGYRIFYEGNRLIVRVRRQPADLRIENMKIAVDAGHGGDNDGATGVTSGIREKDYTLRIARELEKELINEGATVFMTRKQDETLSMPERISMLENENPDFLISIHLNSSAKDSIKGVSTYYRYPGFRPLSKYILDRMLELDLDEFGLVGSFNFALSGSPAFHKDVARKITEGIKDWLRECRKM